MKSKEKQLLVGLVILSFLGCIDREIPDRSAIPTVQDPGRPRSKVLFDFGWRFFRGDVERGQEVTLDDSSWRILDLPHDWSIEDITGTDSPLDPEAVGGLSTGYFVGGVGWYRKEFSVPSALSGRRFYLEFEGVYMNADVWLNGRLLGNHPYGYTSFGFDVTSYVEMGADNTVAVRVANEGQNSRWYSGSGIYRHVWLTIADPVHVEPWGTSVTTPQVDASSATVVVTTRVVNERTEPAEVNLVTRVLNEQGVEIAKAETPRSLPANATSEFTQEVTVASPELWSTESPALYSAVTEVLDLEDPAQAGLVDRLETPFGIRTLEFSAENGFRLNGQPTLLKGGCMHHDNGPLGAAAYDRAEERRVELMKASGFNAIRCAHNPPSPSFLDACDRLGMLVIDEAFDMWREQKNPEDYHLYFDQWWKRDIESMVFRDRNHPSVIMWSTGNEIPNRHTPEVAQVSETLSDYVHRLDPSRPVTSAVNTIREDKDLYFATLDVCGYNYAPGSYESDHKRLPERIIYGAESFPLDAYEAWMPVVDYPWVIGDFVWTGFDYLGEASIGWLGYPHRANYFPWNHAFCGDIDICGFKRAQSYYRDVLWKNGQMISIFVKPPQPSFETLPGKAEWSKWHWQDVVDDWTWRGFEGTPFEVEVYSGYEQAELFLNGQSLDKKETSRRTRWLAKWEVPYQPGVLKAVGYRGGMSVAAAELSTSGEPEKIRLTPDRTQIRSSGQDLSYVTVELLDSQGVRNPKADNLVRFEIDGPGSILAVASSNPMSTESFRKPQRKAYQGRCLVVVKSAHDAGTIILKATSPGLGPASVSIVSQ